MEKRFLGKLTVFLCVLSCTLPAYCNVIWPGMVVAQSIYSIIPLAIISVTIEGIIFYFFLKTAYLWDALCMSLVGNIASTLVGTAITSFFTLPINYFAYQLLGNFSPRIDTIISLSFMYLGNCLLELLAIKGAYGYSIRQLFIPVLIGNFITYAFAAYYLTTLGEL